MIASIWIVFGLGLLTIGGELLVRGASALAAALRISPLVIGLTVVAFGTSAPELAVTLQSAYVGKADIALGNVVGSNITNVLLILGLSSIVAPLVVSSQLVRFDVPLMIGVSLLMWLVCLDGSISRLDGCLLFGLLIGYLVWSVRQSRRESKQVREEFAAEFSASEPPTLSNLVKYGMFVVGGLVTLSLGANRLIDGCVTIARLLHITELVIGLTIVALGTSLPELVTSVVASLRGERDIAVGNVVGSNLFNILAVLGLGSIFSPAGIGVSSSALRFDIPVMVAVAVASLPIFFTGWKIDRWEGVLFLFFYALYNTYVVSAALEAPVPTALRVLVFAFVMPLAAVTIVVGLMRTWRASDSRKGGS